MIKFLWHRWHIYILMALWLTIVTVLVGLEFFLSALFVFSIVFIPMMFSLFKDFYKDLKKDYAIYKKRGR